MQGARFDVWWLYSLTEAVDRREYSHLLRRMSAVLRLREGNARFAWAVYGSRAFACFLTEQTGHLSLGHDAVYVVLWPGRPLLAVHCPEIYNQHRLPVALRLALGYDPVQLRSVPNASFDEACLATECYLREFLVQQERYVLFQAPPYPPADS
ncbi:hypothetical protein V5799_005742 [Amblyomma americanum]|uniref:Uncharacterized protein n=1 Tax=Amblyomma americanum TaxID=6943 RepID=A0AAQ4DYE3_AMBAM